MNLPLHTTRFLALDGIRGWASFMVILSHIIYDLCGHYNPELRYPPLHFFMNGNLAVFVFFILSGDALSSHFIQTGKREALEKLAIKRYFRLMVPIAASVILIFILIKMNLSYYNQVAPQLQGIDWIRRLKLDDHHLLIWLKFMVIEVFTYDYSVYKFNSMLWTMPIEMAGSMLIFVYLFLYHRFEKPLFVLMFIIALFLFIGSHYAAFFIGVAFSILRHNGFFDTLNKRMNIWIFCAVFILIWVCMTYRITAIMFEKYHTIAASALVFLFYSYQKVHTFFENSLSQFLAKISFPLYLTHFCVIITVTFGLLNNHPVGQSIATPDLVLIIGASIISSLILATLFLPVEKFAINFSSKVADFILKKPLKA